MGASVSKSPGEGFGLLVAKVAKALGKPSAERPTAVQPGAIEAQVVLEPAANYAGGSLFDDDVDLFGVDPLDEDASAIADLRRVALPAEDPEVLEIMRPLIERTIAGLNKKKFLPDPIAGGHFSRIVSVMSSSYKRHGFILEAAILNRLKKAPKFIAWNDPTFQVPPNADLLANGALGNPGSIVGNQVNYGPGHRTLQVDAIVYDKDAKTLRAYEVKRGFGYHDAGKRRSILRDALCLSVLLKSYGESRGLEVSQTSAHVIFYYGAKSIPAPFALTGKELDDHFGWPVYAEVEQVNDLFRTRLFEILAS